MKKKQTVAYPLFETFRENIECRFFLVPPKKPTLDPMTLCTFRLVRFAIRVSVSDTQPYKRFGVRLNHHKIEANAGGPGET